MAATLKENCFELDDLTFFTCIPVHYSLAEIDHNMSAFFSGLRKNTMRFFSALSAKAVGPETMLALKNHSKSLESLMLDGLASSSIRQLSRLQHCVALQVITIVDADREVNLEETENDIFLEVVQWLGNCKNLRVLRLTNLVSAPAIMTQVSCK